MSGAVFHGLWLAGAGLTTKPYHGHTKSIPSDFIQSHETVHPGARSWRSTNLRVYRVGGDGARWWVGQFRPNGQLRSIDHLGYHASHAAAQATLDAYGRAMRMREVDR